MNATVDMAPGSNIQLEQNHGLHEPVVYVQTANGVVPVSLCTDCDTCNNTACYDFEKLKKHHYGSE